MKQTDPQMKIRLPVDLKQKIEESAKANNRTMTADIVARLQASFDDDKMFSPEFSVEIIEKLDQLQREMENFRRPWEPKFDSVEEQMDAFCNGLTKERYEELKKKP